MLKDTQARELTHYKKRRGTLYKDNKDGGPIVVEATQTMASAFNR